MQKYRNSIFILGMVLLLGISSSTLAFAEIDTDKPVYSKGQLVEISGSIDLPTDETVNIIKIEIINLNDENNKIVDEYTPIDDNNAFSSSYETVAWEAGEYKVTIRYNQDSEEAEFEISDSSSSLSADNTATTQSSSSDDDDSTATGSSDDDDSTATGSSDDDDSTATGSSDDDDSTATGSSDDDDSTSQQQEFQSSTPSTTTPGLPVNPQTAPASNNELDIIKNQNQALQSENNQLKTQIEELNKRVEQLDAIVKEQIRVMMETLAALKSEN